MDRFEADKKTAAANEMLGIDQPKKVVAPYAYEMQKVFAPEHFALRKRMRVYLGPTNRSRYLLHSHVQFGFALHQNAVKDLPLIQHRSNRRALVQHLARQGHSCIIVSLATRS